MSRQHLFCASMLASVACIGAAFAEEATAPVYGGEIIVTAQKKAERLLDVPMSISAVTAEALTEANIGSTGQLQQLSPGLVTVSNGLSFTPAIRGISSVGTSPGDEANVSIYLDDVYLGATIAGLFDLRDIERVEVLKGPQGTLFGRNATGGALRVVTKAPSFTPTFEAATDYGFDFEELKASAYVSGPLTDKLAASLTGYYLKNDGYLDGVGPINAGRKYATAENWSLRGKLLFVPSDDLKVTLSADYSDRDDNAIYALVPVNGQTSQKNTSGVVIPEPGEFSSGTQPIVRVKNRGVGLDVAWNGDWGTVRSITAYRQVDGLFQTDNDRTNIATVAGQFSQGQKTFSQELNVASDSEGRINWLTGLYFYYSDAYLDYFTTFTGDAPAGAPVATFGNDVSTVSYAGFGEVTFDATEKLSFIAGGRYTWETKRLNYFDIYRPAGIRTAIDEHSWSSPSFRLVGKYDISDNTNVYASVSTGFKSGVYNSYSYPVNVVNPEKITAYEVGAKSRLGDLTLTGAAFHYDYRDIQVQAQNNVGGVLVVTLTNAARAEIQGAEVSLSGPLGEHFDFNVGVSALANAEYTQFTTAQVFVPNASGGATSVAPYDASGSSIIRAPDLQASARVTYTTGMFGGVFRATGSYSYNSGFAWQAGDTVSEPSYSLVNARVSWDDPKERFTYSLFGENLTDEWYSMYTPTGAVGVSAAYARPRQIGVGVSVKF